MCSYHGVLPSILEKFLTIAPMSNPVGRKKNCIVQQCHEPVIVIFDIPDKALRPSCSGKCGRAFNMAGHRAVSGISNILVQEVSISVRCQRTET